MSDDISKIKLARNTVCEMLEDRGYELEGIKEKIKGMNTQETKELLNNNDLDINVVHKDNKDNLLTVKFFLKGKKKLNESDLKRESALVSESLGFGNIYKGTPNIIMISREKPPSNVYNVITAEPYKNVQIFRLSELLFNPTKHALVPKHTLLNNEEAKDICLFTKSDRKDFPKINKDDPIAKYYGMKPGDICRIERNSETSGISYFYRHVK